MAKIHIRKDESIEKALRKFKSKMKREGILDELRKREFYEKPSQERKRKYKKAVQREKRRRKREEW